jgi:hypothetical protein
MGTFMGVNVMLYTLDGGTLSASHLSRHNPKEKLPRNPWRGVWVGAKTDIDAVQERKKVLYVSTIETRFLLRLAIILNALGFAITYTFITDVIKR